MEIARAREILDPEHREAYESLEPVNEACRMGVEALRRRVPESPYPDGDAGVLAWLCWLIVGEIEQFERKIRGDRR